MRTKKAKKIKEKFNMDTYINKNGGWINVENKIETPISTCLSSNNSKLKLSINDIKEEQVERITSGLDGIDYLYGYNNFKWGLPKRGISLWAGEQGVGKSRVAIHLAKNLVRNGKKVLYIQGEVSLSSFKNWVQKENKGECSLNNFFVSDTKVLKEQLDTVVDCQPDVVFVDSINMINEFGTGTGRDIRNIIDGNENTCGYREICKLGIHVIFISHLNKQGNVKGNTDLPHLVDTVMELENYPQLDDTDLHLGLFTMTVKKNRYGETGLKSKWGHEEKGVVLINSTDFNDKWNRTHNIVYKKIPKKYRFDEEPENKTDILGSIGRFINWI